MPGCFAAAIAPLSRRCRRLRAAMLFRYAALPDICRRALRARHAAVDGRLPLIANGARRLSLPPRRFAFIDALLSPRQHAIDATMPRAASDCRCRRYCRATMPCRRYNMILPMFAIIRLRFALMLPLWLMTLPLRAA